ncbi:hypothetical protein ONZ45_g2826 [Pleurotus djamor]|nr:hypothetical protein ONZ45_g2826 [Pleurotus djamor]
MSLRLCITLFCIIYAGLVIAKPINVTIDDRYGAWPAFGLSQNISYGEGWFDSGFDKCNGCQFLPNMAGFNAALNQTWKRATYERDKLQDEPKIATFTFNGTAVYVNIIRGPTTAGRIKGNMELLFTLDGVASRIEDDAKPVVFPQTPFSQSSLPQGEHTLTIQNGDPKGKHGSCMVFLDSIVYTIDDSMLPLMGAESASNSPSTDTSAGDNVAIAAGICGALAGILLLLLVFVSYRFYIKRRRSRAPPPSLLSGPRTLPGDNLGSPSMLSWHRSWFVKAGSEASRSKYPTSAYAPSVASSRRHILAPSSITSWVDPSMRGTPTEYDSTLASKSVKVGSEREYLNPYSRRDPLMAVQEWQQRQSRIRDSLQDSVMEQPFLVPVTSHYSQGSSKPLDEPRYEYLGSIPSITPPKRVLRVQNGSYRGSGTWNG